jgi:hypothetical protein
MHNLQTPTSQLVSAVYKLNFLTTNMSYLRVTYVLCHVISHKSMSAFIFSPSEYNFIYVYSHYTHLNFAVRFEPFLSLSDAVNKNAKLQTN